MRAPIHIAIAAAVGASTACGGELAPPVTSDASVPTDATVIDSAKDSPAVVDANDGAPADGGVKDAALEADAAPVCNAIVHTGSTATAFQIDSRHRGAQLGDTLSTPLCERWKVTFGGNTTVSYPVVAGGLVFVNVSNFNSATDVYALDEATGATVWGPVSITGQNFMSGPAYDGNRVFSTYGWTLVGLDPQTGTKAWQASLQPQFYSHNPVASGGSVYVIADESGGTLFSVDEGDGGIQWTQQLGLGGGLAVAQTELFASVGCEDVYSFGVDGGARWFHQGPCSGGIGNAPVVFDGGVWDLTSSPAIVLSADAGKTIGYFQSDSAPAFSDDTAYLVRTGVLTAVEPGTNVVRWTYGSGIVLPALVVGPHVVVTSTTGEVSVVDKKTGALVSTALTQKNAHAYRDIIGMAAADGMLFVPSDDTLVAY